MSYEFELCPNTAEATKNICWRHGDGSRNFVWVARTPMIGEDQISLRLDSKAVLKVVEANPLSSPQRVLGELCISEANVVHHHQNHVELVRLSKLPNFSLFLPKHAWTKNVNFNCMCHLIKGLNVKKG